MEFIFANLNKACKLFFQIGANLKINLVKIDFRNNHLPFSHFINSFFISIKLISISRLKIGFDIFIILETKKPEIISYIKRTSLF